MVAGVNTRKLGLDIVGRIDPATRRRTGGLIGLHSNQIEWVETAQGELRGGDPDALRNYLKRKARDRRYDGVVKRAIKEGRAIRPDQRDRMIKSYAARLLRIRGDTIARTETLSSLHAAQREALQQQVDAGLIQSDWITLEWDAAEDMATRESHRALNGMKVTGLEGYFVSPVTGAAMRHPGDRDMGAPASETINCRCRLRVDIDFTRRFGRG